LADNKNSEQYQRVIETDIGEIVILPPIQKLGRGISLEELVAEVLVEDHYKTRKSQQSP
jgi:hypothetical protein